MMVAGLSILCLIVAIVFFRRVPTAAPSTVADRLQQFGPAVDARLRPDFAKVGVAYPPAHVTLIGLKQERRLEMWAGNSPGTMRRIKSYPVLAASGNAGPKLREGDRQVPEGIYEIEWLNPNSRFHVSMRVNYPNADDKRRAREEDRDIRQLGGDIMIHGGAASIGCLAIGDPAIEELFVLVTRTGIQHTQVILAPCDFRVGTTADLPEEAPPWTPELHDRIRQALTKYSQN